MLNNILNTRTTNILCSYLWDWITYKCNLTLFDSVILSIFFLVTEIIVKTRTLEFYGPITWSKLSRLAELSKLSELRFELWLHEPS